MVKNSDNGKNIMLTIAKTSLFVAICSLLISMTVLFKDLVKPKPNIAFNCINNYSDSVDRNKVTIFNNGKLEADEKTINPAEYDFNVDIIYNNQKIKTAKLNVKIN